MHNSKKTITRLIKEGAISTSIVYAQRLLRSRVTLCLAQISIQFIVNETRNQYHFEPVAKGGQLTKKRAK